MREHIHYALYASVILAVLLIHGNDPIAGTSSKLTIVLMSLLIFGEAAIRVVKELRKDTA
ncbi:MAG: hypothetical protein QNJ14_00200 [Woeseiaceae bacterium]|nr:hypothetical protein [Woeseiaceae bacterium]